LSRLSCSITKGTYVVLWILLGIVVPPILIGQPVHHPPPYDIHKVPSPYYLDDTEAQAMVTDREPYMDGRYDSIWEHVHIYALRNLLSGSPEGLQDIAAGFQVLRTPKAAHFFIRVVDDLHTLEDEVTLYLNLGFGVEELTFKKGEDDRLLLISTLKGVQAKFGPPPPKGHESWTAEKGYTIACSIPVSLEESVSYGLNMKVLDFDEPPGISSAWQWVNGIVSGGNPGPPLGKLRVQKDFKAGSDQGFLPRQVWYEKDGVLIIEPEEIDHFNHWRLKTKPKGYTGNGYLEWQGPDRSLPPLPFLRRSNDDYSNERQGPQQEWLLLRFVIENPGTYIVDLRNLHKMEDGDNDVWFARLGQSFGLDSPIKRMGDNLKDGKGFTWLDWGTRELELPKGTHVFYVGGRSIGFGVDRIIFYRPEKEAYAKDLDTPASEHSINK